MRLGFEMLRIKKRLFDLLTTNGELLTILCQLPQPFLDPQLHLLPPFRH